MGGSRSVDRRQVRRQVGASGDRSSHRSHRRLVRPDGYVAWVGDITKVGLDKVGLDDALTTWFGPPAAQPNAAYSDERRTGAGDC